MSFVCRGLGIVVVHQILLICMGLQESVSAAMLTISASCTNPCCVPIPLEAAEGRGHRLDHQIGVAVSR